MSYHILDLGCHFYPTTLLDNLFYTHGQDIYLLLIRHYSRALPMDTLLVMDYNFKLHRTFLVDSPSDHLFCTDDVLQFIHYVYKFGPKHRKQTLYDIITNPVPGV